MYNVIKTATVFSTQFRLKQDSNPNQYLSSPVLVSQHNVQQLLQLSLHLGWVGFEFLHGRAASPLLHGRLPGAGLGWRSLRGLLAFACGLLPLGLLVSHLLLQLI